MQLLAPQLIEAQPDIDQQASLWLCASDALLKLVIEPQFGGVIESEEQIIWNRSEALLQHRSVHELWLFGFT